MISDELELLGIAGAYKSFKLLRPRAFRADLWRLMATWYHGGIYIDAKLAFNSTVDWIDFENDEFVICASKDTMYTENAIIAMT